MSWVATEASPGTDEVTWAGCAPLAALPAVAWGSPARVVVVAPHPDDEVLGVGGSLRALHRAGAEVLVVAVTDGEGSHPGSQVVTPDGLRRTRAAERAEALRRLGMGAAPVHRLGLPDGAVGDGEGALQAALAELLDELSLCLAPWRGDGHPDHEATGRAAAAAARATGARLLEFPVWAWHWSTPDATGDRALPWATAVRHELEAGDRAAKDRAIDAFASQIAPVGPDAADRAVLAPSALARFRRPYEVLFEAAAPRANP